MAAGNKPVAVRAHLLGDGKVLLARRRSSGEWSTVGGRPDTDESPEETLRREVREELGIEIEAFRRLPDREATREGDPGPVAVFVVTSWRGVPENLATHEHTEIAWFRSDELANQPMHQLARQEALSLLGL